MNNGTARGALLFALMLAAGVTLTVVAMSGKAQAGYFNLIALGTAFVVMLATLATVRALGICAGARSIRARQIGCLAQR